MKQSAIITSVESRITVPQLTLSNFYSNPMEESTKHTEKRKNNKICNYFDKIDWSSAESKVDGYVEITCVKGENYEIEYITVPVVTSFMFTCTKGSDEYYEVAWMISLS
jgi:hypothetical protein